MKMRLMDSGVGHACGWVERGEGKVSVLVSLSWLEPFGKREDGGRGALSMM